ncbi:SPOR domain-containing protein [Qipengyuania sp. JC766]|uniref:SPOR domain-containing protein n=1 Tax=Qipengyuania sp. JC766 TaxID=3232139 RepID=UPI00345B2F30
MKAKAVLWGMGALAAAGLAAPALADVKAGVEAWARGDYDAAVGEWRDLAAAGDPDAQFNMAQAYRLGRGVEPNARQAEVYYAQAAAQGHVKAADNYGLLLFQAGRREEAMPYILAASERGDPRAQYLLGIAHFNGEQVDKDWVRAYALLTIANSAGLPQASGALKQMDDFIPLSQRQQAQALIPEINRQADAKRAQDMAAIDLEAGEVISVAGPVEPAPARVPAEVSRIPQPVQSTAVPPSVAAARAAVAEAARVTGTESPAEAGADFASAGPATRPAIVATTGPVQPAPRPVRTESAPPPRPSSAAPTPARTGPWRVQLGAFSVHGNADRLWDRIAGNPALAGKAKLVVPSGRLAKLQASGFATRADAQKACDALRRSGQNCLVTR